ncbi:MAG: hydrogenase maturation protease [Pirellulaceae bacterium]
MSHSHSIEADFDPSKPLRSAEIHTLIIGCGNILRGDDAAGPVLIRRMWERGLPADVHCADGGTGGMDVAFQMRGVPHVILVDACTSGSKPGSIFELPGEEVEQLPPMEGINLHAFRWDHAIAFSRWLLKEDYPQKITVYLIEGDSFQIGETLSESVDRAIDQLVDRLFDQIGCAESMDDIDIEFTAEGYMRIGADVAQRFFPEEMLVPLWRDDRLVLLPTRGAAAGGMILKRRNVAGDRCLLLSETFGFEQLPVGTFPATWNEKMGALELRLSVQKDRRNE